MIRRACRRRLWHDPLNILNSILLAKVRKKEGFDNQPLTLNIAAYLHNIIITPFILTYYMKKKTASAHFTVFDILSMFSRIKL